MRHVELGRFRHVGGGKDEEVLRAHPKKGWVAATPRERMRLGQLIDKGCLVKTAESYRHAEDLLELVTFFVQEDYGSIKIGVADSLKVIERIQLAHPREVTFLGAFDGDHMSKILKTCRQHHLGNGWYKPHADVLAWTKHKDFQKA